MKKKKKNQKPEILSQVGRFLEYASAYCPDLLPVVATLYPFDDVIGSYSAGPQGDDDREPYFSIEVAYEEDSTLDAEITKEGIFAKILVRLEDDWVVGDHGWMTLRQLHDFLRQVPRPASSFLTSSIGGK